MMRMCGALFLGAVLMAIYIMFVRPGGVEGTWAFFAINFLQALIFSIFGYLSVNDQDIKELDDVK